MKPRAWMLLLLAALFLIPPIPVQAQDPGGTPQAECDPNAVRDWLTQRQSWRNATQDVLDAQGVSIQNARTYLHQHLQAIEDLDRPACADSVMLWTYFLYSNLQHLLTCAQNGDSACVAETQTRLQDYREKDALNANALGLATGFNAEQFEDLRPDGWTMGPAQAEPTAVPTQAQQPIPAVQDEPDIPPQPADPLVFAGPQIQQLGPIYDEEYNETYSAEITIQDAQLITEGNSAAGEQYGFTLVMINVSITNLGPDILSYIGPDNFQIRDAQGELNDSIYITETDACELDYVELAAGQNVSACVAFEVPSTGSLDLLYSFDPYGEYLEGQYLSFKLR